VTGGPLHQPSALPLPLAPNSGETPKDPKSRLGGASAPHADIDSGCDRGGVCKAERAAEVLARCEMYALAMLSFECEYWNEWLRAELLSRAGLDNGVNW
jgi:hypothetical protein